MRGTGLALLAACLDGTSDRRRNTPWARAVRAPMRSSRSSDFSDVCRWAKWLVVLAVVATTGRARAATLTRGPYLQLRTTHSITVVWAMNAPAPCGLALRAPTGATTVLGRGHGRRVCHPRGRPFAGPVIRLHPARRQRTAPIRIGLPDG